jgi:hypothetical protein
MLRACLPLTHIRGEVGRWTCSQLLSRRGRLASALQPSNGLGCWIRSPTPSALCRNKTLAVSDGIASYTGLGIVASCRSPNSQLSHQLQAQAVCQEW